MDDDLSNPTAPGSKDPWAEDKFSIVVSGEVAYHIRQVAANMNIKPQHYARMMLTDGLKGAHVLPNWWPRGSMVYKK